ncbi:hypothetical protein N0V82_004326 [Gnomoniopsis sp. IMI 355080]|nr:hypothetical protein N0V82_004326 [Gnomoniopsis sp. IMI 355080]
MLRKGSLYYEEIAKRYPEFPIYTLGLPKGKLYIVTGPDLVYAVDRQPKAFSFNPILVEFARRLFGASPEAVEKLSTYTQGRHGEGLNPEILRAQHDTLAPGKHLASMDMVMLQGVLDYFDTKSQSSEHGHEIALCAFFRDLTTVVSTRAVYGPKHNPYEDKAVRDGLWDIYSDFAWLGLNFLPEIITPKGNAGRTRIFHAMQKYFANNGPQTASALIQARAKIQKMHDVPQSDIDQFEFGISFALVANSAATMFWVVYYAYSLPEWLEEIRKEILSLGSIREQLESVASSKLGPGETAVESSPPVLVNVAEVVEKCVLVTSFINEILRVQSTSASARVVMEDTLLDGKYLLKKGNFVLSPSAVMHRDEKAWGPTAGKFDPRRFISPKGQRGRSDDDKEAGKRRREQQQQQHRVPISAHRTWGGGVNHCPGRHFAMHEFVAVLVVMVLQYDVVPSSGSWVFPKTMGHLAASIMQPVKDVKAVIRERRDVPHWDFVWRT